MESTYITKDCPNYSFGFDYYQIFANKWTFRLIAEEIIRMRHTGIITDEDMKIVTFIYNFKFATANIIAEYFGDTNVEAVQGKLDRLVKNRILNKFMLSRMNVDKIEKDALLIYCLDNGGKILLTQYGDPKNNINNWNTAKNLKSSAHISNDLVTAQFYVRLTKTCPSKLDYMESNPEYRIKRDLIIPAFEFALKTNDVRQYFIGEIVRSWDIPLGFRNASLNLESVLCTNTWKKYFADSQERVPVLFLIAENDEVALEAAKIMATGTNLSAFRITTDERMKKNLAEAFMKYDVDKQKLIPIKASVFKDVEND